MILFHLQTLGAVHHIQFFEFLNNKVLKNLYIFLRGSDNQKYNFFHYCVYFKFVTVMLFVAISQNFTKFERVVFELCAKVCE